MKAMVSGSHGFVGHHLTRFLHASGDVVTGLDLHDAEPVDITDRDAVVARVQRSRPDVIYHLAARSHVGESWGDESGVHRVNVDGTANVLAAARQAGVARVLVVGSAEQYGRVAPDEVPIDENAELRPESPYARSKTRAEALARRAAVEHGLGTVCVRAFNHTGAGQSDRFLVPAIAGRVAAAERRHGDATVTVGNLDPVRDFSDVRDVVRAYRLLAVHGDVGAVYNVCSGRGVAIGQIVERLLALAAIPLRPVVDAALVRSVDVPVNVGNPARLAAATGWRPEFSLDDTLAAVLAHARDQVT